MNISPHIYAARELFHEIVQYKVNSADTEMQQIWKLFIICSDVMMGDAPIRVLSLNGMLFYSIKKNV